MVQADKSIIYLSSPDLNKNSGIMKRVSVLWIFLLIAAGAFAQKKDSSGNSRDKNKQTQDTRYQEGASGVKRSISYKFSNIITDDDPGNGKFRYNNDTVSGISYLFLDDIDLSGEDQTKWYSTWDDTTGATGRGRLNIVEYEGKNVNIFDVTGVFVEENGYWKIPVRYVSGSLPADGVTYYYIFERIENKDKTGKTDDGDLVEATEVAVAAVAAEVKEEIQPIQVSPPEPEVRAEPVVQVDTVKQEVKIEETEEIAAAVTVAAVIAEPKEEPHPVQQGQPAEAAEVGQPAPAQPAPLAAEPSIAVSQPKPVMEQTAPAATVVIARQAEKTKDQQRVRTSHESQQAPKTQTPQPSQQKKESQPVQSTKPAQPVQQAPKTTQAASRPTQPTPTNQAPSGGTVSSGYTVSKRSDGARRWHGIIETGYGFKVSDYGINNYRINFIGSFDIGQHFMIGFGLGYRNYSDKPDKHPEWYMVSSKSQIPIFIDLRTVLTKKRLSPYLAFGFGSSTEKSKVDSTSYGSFINPSAGIWYRLSKNTALFAGVAYEMQQMEFANKADDIPYRKNNSSISLNIGIKF